MAFDRRKDTMFERMDAAHLFAPATTRLAVRRGVFVRGFVYTFISMFAPQYSRAAIEDALAGRPIAEHAP
jgi:LysR family cys regulon transcriptional activator